MRLILVFSFISLLGLVKSAAQRAVTSKKYDLMLKTLLDKNTPTKSVSAIENTEDFIWLDAREQREFEVSKIANAYHVGYDQLDLSVTDTMDKNTPIMVYCSVGYRSGKVTEQLREKGFTAVYNLYGGIFEWKNQDKTVLDANNQKTEAVHAYDKLWGVWLNKGKKIYK